MSEACSVSGNLREEQSAAAVLGSSAAPVARPSLEAVLAAATHVSMIATDTEGTVTLFNSGAERMLGYRAEEVVGRQTPLLFHPSVPVAGIPSGEVFQVLVELARSGPDKEHTCTWVRNDGSYLAVNLVVTAVHDEQGDLGGYLAIATDISDHKRIEAELIEARDDMELRVVKRTAELETVNADLRSLLQQRRRYEESLRRSEARFRHLSENAPDIIYTLDRNGVVTYVNPTWERSLGHPPDEVLGCNFTDFARPEDTSSFVRIFRRIIDRKKTANLRRQLVHRDGSLRFFDMSGAPNLDRHGQVTGMVGMLKDITERHRVMEALRRSEVSLARAQAMAHVGSWEYEPHSGTLLCSAEAFKIHGITLPADGTISFEQFLQSVHRQDRETVRRHICDAVDGERRIDFEHRIVRPGGEVRIVHELGEAQTDGEAFKLVGVIQDITERRRSQEQMRLLVRVFENTIEGIMVTDADAVIRMINRAFETITGYTGVEAIGHRPSLLSSGLHDREFYHEMWSALLAEGQWQGEIWNRRKNGEAYPQWQTITAIKDLQGNVTHYVGVFHDITENKRSEEQITYQAYHDALTGLPNRALFNDRLRMALAQRKHLGLAVLFLDLDNFKQINDSLGHAVGDLLLQAVARRLLRWLRDEDTVARLGGDEFIIMLQSGDAPDLAVQVAQRILDSLAEPIMVRGHELYITASIGITFSPEDGTDLETLVANADTAMYRAKDEGRNRSKLFTPAMNERVVRRLALEGHLRKALERGELTVYYQPKVELASESIIGVEALLRWQRPGSGLVLPEHFIPVAEETGLIVPIGSWVLRTACEWARQWHEEGYTGLQVAVNLSPRQFQQRDLVEVVATILEQTGLPPHCLELEVTENVVMYSVEEATKTFLQLADLGVRLSMDDFGRGYSSLYYLKRFPMHTLKIDRSFMSDVAADPDDASIVNTIISMSRNLNLTVVAEGVETQAQLDFLRQRRCDQFQGFLFSRPLPPDRISAMLRSKAGHTEHTHTVQT